MTMEESSLDIQWYPGHMAKARRMLAESVKLVDVVIEMVDARAPASTRNPDFDDLFGAKPRVVVLNKADLADPEATRAWIRAYRARGWDAISFSANAGKGVKEAVSLVERAARPVVERMKAKGVNKTVRAMIVGIPNVGKSTFINRLRGSAAAKAGNRPGVTRGKQWISAGAYDIENVSTDTYGVFTNTPPSGAFRGYSSPQLLYAQEQFIDELAEACGGFSYELLCLLGQGSPRVYHK